MRSALVTILIVLQHAAQLPCRSMTRDASHPPLSTPSPKASSREDLETIIARNREITDLLIPLLEANLEAKKQDQSKRNELLNGFPFQDGKSRTRNKVLPSNKRKSKERQPLAVILASELRSQKRGRSKVHARKAFLIRNNNKASNSEEDYDIDTGRKHKDQSAVLNKIYENKHVVERSESNQSDDEYDLDTKMKYKDYSLLLNKNDKNRSTIEDSETNSSEEVYNISSKHKDNYTFDKNNAKHQKGSHVKKNDLSKENQDVSDEVSKKDVEILPNKNDSKTKLVWSNVEFVNSNFHEYDKTQSSESRDDDEVHNSKNKNEFNSQEYDKSENQASERKENKLEHHKKDLSNENSVELKDNYNKPNNDNNKKDQTSNTESYKVSKELIVIDVSKEQLRDDKISEENYKSETYSLSDEYNEITEKDNSHSEKDTEENSSSQNMDLSNDNVSNESEKSKDTDEKFKQSSESMASNTSEESKTSEGQNENEAKNQDHYYHVTNENNISEPAQYKDDYLDVSNYHKKGSYEEVYGEVEENHMKEDNNNSASYENVLNGDNYNNLNVENETHNEDDYQDNDTHDFNTNKPVNTSEDNTLSVEDDNYRDDWIDDVFNSGESKTSNEDDNKKQGTFGEKIANKYADDSKYTVENYHTLDESSGELSKFNVESVEGLIEVLQQDQENKEKKCERKENNKYEPDLRRPSDHDVHKSYKLSFKFNK